MDDSTPGSPRRPWVLQWARDQAFWRDIASQTISGILVLLVVAAAAAIASPAVRPIAFAFAAVAALFAVLLGGIFGIGGRILGEDSPPSTGRLVAAVLFCVAWLLLFVVIVELVDWNSLFPTFKIDAPWLDPLAAWLRDLLG